MLFEVAPKPYRPDHTLEDPDGEDLDLVIFYRPLSVKKSRAIVSFYDADTGEAKDLDAIQEWSDTLMERIVAMRWNGGHSKNNADIVETLNQDVELSTEIGMAIAQGKVSDKDRSLFPRGDALGES